MSKYHTVSIRKKNFKDLQEIQKAIPINVSLNQTIEWLIKIGQKQINITKSELPNENSSRIPK
tara:strand:- start:5623 stop:5811 length:189 start_codon:yes stop_codon:yes gene_type:complete